MTIWICSTCLHCGAYETTPTAATRHLDHCPGPVHTTTSHDLAAVYGRALVVADEVSQP